MRRRRLAGKTHTRTVLGRDIPVASLLDGDLRLLNLSGTLVGCDRGACTWSRTTCHEVLGADPDADGVNYYCRSNRRVRPDAAGPWNLDLAGPTIVESMTC
ncbi:MAG: hypothetical protein EOP24_40395 [Hyphomicrobiales bacterium]|nr:MAG: hypothetical protein EOP24_40395 [Hyphomicrobiales bacterium]